MDTANQPSCCTVQATCNRKNQEKEILSTAPSHLRWHPNVDLNHFSENDREAVRRMLFEQSDVFAQEEGDIGCIPGLQLKMNTTYNTPVQRSYNSIPRQLYKKVKEYVQNLLNRGWIRKSVSAYSSSDVCA